MTTPLPERSYLLALRDGALVPVDDLTVPIGAHALRYGLSVFEGIRAYVPASGGLARPFALDAHLARMRRSLELCELPAVDLDGLPAAIDRLLAANEATVDSYVRVSATATSQGTMAAPVSMTTFATLVPMGRKRWLKEGVRLRVALGPQKPDGALLPHAAKIIAHYAGTFRAKVQARREGYDDVLLLDHLGRLAEAPTANLMLVTRGRLRTPRVDCAILPGVTRGVLLELAESLGIEVEEAELWPEDLPGASEAFLCGTGIEIGPIRSIDGTTFPDENPVTAALIEAFFARVRA
ncbi:MAG: aminotransferase class IV [Alphaproteobacteria bacterium]|nr:aminotransferase class IV [Alphaproteobacteria bacterium]